MSAATLDDLLEVLVEIRDLLKKGQEPTVINNSGVKIHSFTEDDFDDAPGTSTAAEVMAAAKRKAAQKLKGDPRSRR